MTLLDATSSDIDPSADATADATGGADDAIWSDPLDSKGLRLSATASDLFMIPLTSLAWELPVLAPLPLELGEESLNDPAELLLLPLSSLPLLEVAMELEPCSSELLVSAKSSSYASSLALSKSSS